MPEVTYCDSEDHHRVNARDIYCDSEEYCWMETYWTRRKLNVSLTTHVKWRKFLIIVTWALDAYYLLPEYLQVTEIVDGIEVVTNHAEIEEWTNNDIEAMSIIFYNIEPLYQTSIEGSETSHEMWNRLQLEYASVAVANASQLLGKFFQYRMEPSYSVLAHINRLRQMGEELRSVNAPVSEEVLIMRIIQTLPPSYDTFQTVWNTVATGDQTLVNLTAQLVNEELRVKARNNGSLNPADVAFFATHPSNVHFETAYTARGDGRNDDTRKHRAYRNDYRGRSSNHHGNTRGSNQGRRGACYYCGKQGHKENVCRHKKNDERKEARSNNYNARRDDHDYDDKRDNSFACLSSLCFVARKPMDWYANSGATHHMTDQRSFFTIFKEVPPGTWKVNGVGNTQLDTRGIGTVPIHSFVHGVKVEGELLDVLYVPDLGTNLFSIGTATDTGTEVHFTQDKVAFFKNNQQIMSGQRVGKSLYHLKVMAKNAEHVTAAAATNASIPLSLMHLRLAHLNYNMIRKMNNLGAVYGLDLEEGHQNSDGVCEGCIFGKMKRSPFSTGRNRATKPGQIIHSDTGFVPIKTPNGETCYVIFKDDFSNWTSVKLMKQKSEVEELFMTFAAFLKNTTGNNVEILRTDGGTEYGSKQFKHWLEHSGITHQITTPYTPQQNGVSERMNRTAMELARSSMYMRTNKLTNFFKNENNPVLELWGEFLRSAIYVLNRTISNSSTKTPFELLFGRKPNLGNLRVIGCRAYAHVPDAKRKKAWSKSNPLLARWVRRGNERLDSLGTWIQKILFEPRCHV